MFERIKHILEVNNLVTLLSFDQEQLEATVKSYYGEEIKASRYLEKMFDLIIELPKPQLVAIFSKTFNKLELGDTHPLADVTSYVRSLAGALLDFLEATSASPREVERTLVRIKFLLKRKQGLWIDPSFAVVLIILRSQDPKLFERILRGAFTFEDIDQFFRREESLEGIWKLRLSTYIETLCYYKNDYKFDEENLLEIQIHTLNYSTLPKEKQLKWNRLQSQIAAVKRNPSESLPQMAQRVNLVLL